jgi:hypothetical protein
MAHKIAFVKSEDFSYNAEIRKLDAVPGAFSFAITTVWRSAKNPTEEQTALQITLDREGLIALRDIIDAAVRPIACTDAPERDMAGAADFFDRFVGGKPGDPEVCETFHMDFRPETYFENLPSRTLLLSSVNGEERRAALERAIDEEGLDGAAPFLGEPLLDDEERKVWGSGHPAFMGGEYLPAMGQEEVEIARIVLASVTQDVITIRARRQGRFITYSVHDEYESAIEMAFDRSTRPLTMRRLIHFINGTRLSDSDRVGLVRPWIDINVAEGGADPESLRGFVKIKSVFYPQLARWFGRWTDRHINQLARR